MPGAVLGYTITVTNTGQTPYTAANISDDLAGLLADAVYNNDVTATAGAVATYNAPTITWTGNLAIAAAVTITYTVTVSSPQTGAGVLTNQVTSTTPGSSCPPGGTNAACSATVTVLVPGLSISKTASAASVVPPEPRSGLHHHPHQQRPDRVRRGNPDRRPDRPSSTTPRTPTTPPPPPAP